MQRSLGYGLGLILSAPQLWPTRHLQAFRVIKAPFGPVEFAVRMCKLQISSFDFGTRELGSFAPAQDAQYR